MIDKILSGMGNSNLGQRFYTWAAKPGSDKILNRTLPQIETVIATGFHVLATARQDIDKDRKNLLQIQNVGTGLAGLTLGTALSMGIGKFGEKVIDNLDPQKIPPEKLNQIRAGMRIGIPTTTMCFCMRFLLPSVVALFSGKVMDKVRDKREQKKIDCKA